jgi:predicted ArsR family transcriptional regulator
MNGGVLNDPAPAAALGESRALVLDLLRAAPGPLGVREITDRTGLHPNTARFHLDGLVEAGLAQRGSEERDQPGRPRTMYRTAPAGAAAGRSSYRLLAEILATLVAEKVPQPMRAAAEAGRVWGSYLTERPAPFQRVDTDAAIESLLGVLAEIGFAPDTEADDEPVARIRLRHCPFREVAEHHPDVICSLHLGLMQGVLAELRAPVTTDRLEPFVEPNLCLAHLTARPAGD